MSKEARWWRDGVVYQIYPRSFLDTDGDGVGDLEGIRTKLDYLVWLGVDAVWLSPIFCSPLADFGYDVSDYCDIDPAFGRLEDFDRLLDEAHSRGIRIILDWVANHTSDQHPWFKASRSSREHPKRDWYIWREEPNNWVQTFAAEPAWTFDPTTGQHYLHLFLPQQPDLNWANPDVEQAMHDVLRFWLDRGVDGFRADVIHLIGKDPDLPDDPPHLVGTARVDRHDEPGTHELLRRIRKVVDGYPRERMVVGEVNLTEHDRLVRYYGAGDELHLVFNFIPMAMPWQAGPWREHLEEIESAYRPAGAWPAWVLSNHDIMRHRSRLGSEARARAAALLLLTLRGTPFLYAGEELGLEDAHVPAGRRVDPGGRDGCRAPLPWEEGPGHGWASAEPWLPWPPDAARRCVARQRADAASILHLYRRLLAARRASPALRGGDLELVDAPDGVLAYRRRHGTDVRTVAVNFTDREQPVDLAGIVDVSSRGGRDGQAFSGLLAPDEAVALNRGCVD